MIQTTITLTGMDRVSKKIEELNHVRTGREINVGVVESARYPTQGNGGHITEDPPTVAQVAYTNEFGIGDIPSRPFMRNSYRAYLTDKKVKLLLKALLNSDNPVLNNMSAHELGSVFLGMMQKELVNPAFPPNSPATVMIKTGGRGGKTTPLIHTGLLRRSLSYEVK